MPNALLPTAPGHQTQTHLWLVTGWGFVYFLLYISKNSVLLSFIQLAVSQLHIFSSCSERLSKDICFKGFSPRGLLRFLVSLTVKAVSRLIAFLKAVSREAHPLLFYTKNSPTKKSDKLLKSVLTELFI